jgi:hypothetical protein
VCARWWLARSLRVDFAVSCVASKVILFTVDV